MQGGGGGGGGTGDDSDDESRCEYATLTCRRTAGETVVHVKVWFRDDPDHRDARSTVFRAHVLVADTGDVYSGGVTGRQASPADGDDAATAVRRWLENARRALVGSRDGAEEYVYRLDALDGVAAELAWKRRLRPIGAVALGSVRLCRRDAADACRAFVGPLVGRVSAERLRADRAERAAAEDARRLSADNARLLDALRSAADRRQLDDERLTARFVRVLNAKKERLAAVMRELGELKERLPGGPDDDDDDGTTAAVGPVAGRRGGGRRGAGGRAGKRGSTAARATAGKRGRRQTTVRAWRPFAGFDRDGETADDVDVAVVATRRADDDDDDDGRPDATVKDDCGRATDAVVAADSVSAPTDVAESDVFGADTQIDGDGNGGPHEKMETDDCGRGTQTVDAANPVSVPVDDAGFDAFEADTQIDGDDPSSSPSFFRRITSTQLAETDERPPDKDVKPQNKSFLDDLWHGIL